MFSRAACGTGPVARDGAKQKITYLLVARDGAKHRIACPSIDDGYDDFNPRPYDVLLVEPSVGLLFSGRRFSWGVIAVRAAGLMVSGAVAVMLRRGS